MHESTPFLLAAILLAGPARADVIRAQPLEPSSGDTAPARADVVEASATTLLTGGQQTRDGLSGQKPSLVNVVPAFEILSVSARNVTNPLADDLEIVVSTWAAADLAERRWDNGTGSRLTGDVMTGYLKGELFQRRLSLQLGREYVALGAARMMQLDGGQAILTLPYGFGISGYAGSPVSQRFQSRGELVTWNPAGGDLAYGGRLSWKLPVAGAPGRGLDVGASYAMVTDSGETARQDVGLDLRLQPLDLVALTGEAVYSLYEKRLAEASVLVTWSPLRKLHVSADFRQVFPDLLLPRTSILSVFADKERSIFGGGASYDLAHGLSVGADAHLALEPSSTEENGTYTGYEGAVRVAWHAGPNAAGAELILLDAEENGYQALRLYGRRAFGALFVAADLLGHLFKEEVNEVKGAYTGTLSVGYALGRGWTAVVAAREGVTPFMEQQLDVMAKLVYEQTYRAREVR